MISKLRTLGGLDSRVDDFGEASRGIDVLAIICHGYGAPGEDLVPIGSEIASQIGAGHKMRFIFPQAPMLIDPYYGGRAWWPIDFDRLQRATMQRDWEGMMNDLPPLLTERRESLLALIAEATDEASVALGQVVLGGFSQGAMLTTDVALHLPSPPGGLIIWSGALINQQAWRKLAQACQPFPIIQSHGQLDTILPFEAGLALNRMLTETSFEVDFLPFHGPHTIVADSITAAAKLIKRIADK